MPYTSLKHKGWCDFARTAESPGQPSTRRRVVADSRDFDAFEAASQSLGTLLRSLWRAAELTRWQPSFQGKRSWSTVRLHLLAASSQFDWRDRRLDQCLYVPESFTLASSDAIRARRRARWAWISQQGTPWHRLVLIGEVKRIECTAHGYALIIKHAPDCKFLLSDLRYGWIHRIFCGEFASWGLTKNVRLITAATVDMSRQSGPTFESICLLPVTPEWLPVKDDTERARVARLVDARRDFVVNENARGSAPDAVRDVQEPLSVRAPNVI